MPADQTAPKERPRYFFDREIYAWVVLCVSLVLTVAFWSYANGTFKQRGQERFKYRIEKETATLVARMHAYQQVLLGARGLFAASDVVTPDEWHIYVSQLALDENLPGILGTGFAAFVRPNEKDAHIRSMRASGHPAYDIAPAGDRDAYTPIAYLEPLNARNQRAVGYDMFSDPARREAMERARDTGEAAMSARVTLVQETDVDVQPGFLIYLPVYRNHALLTTVAERRAALLGFVYSPFRAHDLMRGIFGSGNMDTEIELYDGAAQPENLLYSSIDTRRRASYVVFNTAVIGGRMWTLRFESRPEYEAATTSVQPWLILFGGAALDFLLFVVMLTNARHIARMQAAARSITQSRDRYLNLVDNVPGTVFRAEPRLPRRFDHVSRNIATLTGESADAFLENGIAFGHFIHADDIGRVDATVRAALDRHEPYEMEYRIRQHDRTVRWVTERGRGVFDEDGRALWVDGVILDVTERKLAENALRDLAFYDPLTALPNRRLLDDRLRQAMLASERNKQRGAILFVDLDNFKAINDHFGHEAGDLILCEVAHRLRESVREADTVARLGGDEFLVMLENLGTENESALEKAQQIATKILTALDEPYVIAGQAHRSTPSIGITIFSGLAQNAGGLIREADQAMYDAKQAGRNTIRVFRGSSVREAE